MDISIPVTIDLGNVDKVALITAGILLATEVVKLLGVIKFPLQEQKNVTVTTPTQEEHPVTVTIPMEAETIARKA